MKAQCPCGDIAEIPEIGACMVQDGTRFWVAQVSIFLLQNGHIGWEIDYGTTPPPMPEPGEMRITIREGHDRLN